MSNDGTGYGLASGLHQRTKSLVVGAYAGLALLVLSVFSCSGDSKALIGTWTTVFPGFPVASVAVRTFHKGGTAEFRTWPVSTSLPGMRGREILRKEEWKLAGGRLYLRPAGSGEDYSVARILRIDKDSFSVEDPGSDEIVWARTTLEEVKRQLDAM